MTAEVAGDLSRCLASSPSLLHLNLNDTSLTDEGVTALAKGLAAGAPGLVSLELALNEVTVEGVKALGVALLGKKGLIK